MWRPILLKVKVGESLIKSRISPYGTKPSLISAWKPLQIPSIKPSRFSNKSLIASLIRGLRNIVAINLPLPSGSSPALKPPGIITICELLIYLTIASTDSSIAAAVKLRTIKVLASAPAASKARALSYSQLLPGKTGMNTRGLAIFTGAVKDKSAL